MTHSIFIKSKLNVFCIHLIYHMYFYIILEPMDEVISEVLSTVTVTYNVVTMVTPELFLSLHSIASGTRMISFLVCNVVHIDDGICKIAILYLLFYIIFYIRNKILSYRYNTLHFSISHWFLSIAPLSLLLLLIYNSNSLIA